MAHTFRYFRSPHAFSTYSKAPKRCDLCESARAGYGGPFSGEDELEFVCEECLVAGELAEVEMTTNGGDAGALEDQLRARGLSGGALEEELTEKTEELETRTPPLESWQDFFWPAHCGDYCCFVKEAGCADLARLAANGDGEAFFRAHLHGDLRSVTDAPAVYAAVRPDSPADNAKAYDTTVYLFECLTCREPILWWDAS